MSATSLAALVAVVAGYASSIYLIVARIETRLDRIEEQLRQLEVMMARIGQRLDDHITDHPGPGRPLTA